jgi:hypothetical protein
MSDTLTNVFTSGVPMEESCPRAHKAIMLASMALAGARSMPEGSALEPIRRGRLSIADRHARVAADVLHLEYMTGTHTVWLAVVRYMVELHTARLVAEHNRKEVGS